MHYKTGSYILLAQKTWTCECCKQSIFSGNRHFVRVEESNEIFEDCTGEPYRKNFYTRFCLKCALSLNNLNNYEKQLLGPVLIAIHEAQVDRRDTNMAKKVSDIG